MTHKKHSPEKHTSEKHRHETETDVRDQSSAAPETIHIEQPADQTEEQTAVVDFMQIVKERDEFLEHLQRMKAEFDNYRKRVQREREELIKTASSDLIADLLEILDNLHRALQSAEETGERNSSLGQGVEMTAQMLFGILGARGLKPIPGLGEPFDPTVHEAVSTEMRPEVEPGMIVQEWQKGYWLGDKVIRPAKVVVSVSPQSQKNTD